jgi:predicted metal-dependent hydrolase
LLSPREQQRTFDWLADWLRRQVKKRPSLIAEFQRRKYYDGKILRVGKYQYTIRIKYADRKTSIADYKDDTIYLTMSNQLTRREEHEHMASLISRSVAESRIEEFTARVSKLNDKHFDKRIKSVKMKNSSSTWGSCSVNGNLNFSTRLLFAPDAVIDYIIIHELAHLVHMNHSENFWKIVATIKPNYQKHEDWLKMNAHLCKF